MTVLTDLKVGDQFLFVAQVAAADPVAGYTLTLFGPGSVAAANATITPAGVMAGQLAVPANQAPVTIVTGFAPISVGDVLSSDLTGETLVAMSAWITPAGVPMWANTPDRKVAYPAAGWTVIGHVNL